MLRQLTIRNYLLVRDVTLDFTTGLTVLTGETGAGKSMILGALDVLLGERFPRDSVGPDAEKAVIEGVFELRPGLADGILSDEDIQDAAGELLLRREIVRTGRARTFLNDRPLPAETLQRLRDVLADFHGQRESQSLFKASVQLESLDAFAGALPQAQDVTRLYAVRSAARRSLEDAQRTLTAHRKDRALLEYQLEEIQRLGLKPGEEEAVESRLTKLEGAEKLSAEASRLLDLLEESNPSLTGLSGAARVLAQGIARTDRDLHTVAEELAEIHSRLKDLSADVRHYLDSLSFDDAELSRLRERRSVIWELRRKHGLTLDQILARADELKSLLLEGEQLEQRCADLEAALASASARLVDAAAQLSLKRQQAAADFAARVVATLTPLGFPEPRFETALTTLERPFDPNRLSAQGADRVEFLFSANPGTKLAALGAVASGGESSRVTLAVKSVLSEQADYPLMVYDEIDLGISGRVADQVGVALAALAQRHQVLVITHLPQIASRADRHLAVEKLTHENSTETTARFLSDSERVQAIASLLAGAQITDRSLASASELLKQSGKAKSHSK